jgi:hypothetical protein
MTAKTRIFFKADQAHLARVLKARDIFGDIYIDEVIQREKSKRAQIQRNRLQQSPQQARPSP